MCPLGEMKKNTNLPCLFVYCCLSQLVIAFLCVFDFRKLPKYGPMIQTPFKNYLKVQKEKLHHKPGKAVASVSYFNHDCSRRQICDIFPNFLKKIRYDIS